MGDDSRGVSELLGYLLLFATVIGGTVVLSTIGLGIVLDSGGEQHREIAETNVARVDAGATDLLGGAPYREVRLEPMGASVGYGQSYTVEITASGGGVDLTGADAVEVNGRTLTYDLAERGRLSYVGGLVAYGQEDGVRTLVSDGPAFRTSGSRLVVQLPLLSQAPRSSTLVSASTGGQVPVVLDRGDSRLVKRVGTDSDGSLATMDGTITVSADRLAGAWEAYFEEREAFRPRDIDGDGTVEFAADTDGDGTLDTASARFETQRLFVRTVSVGVRLGESV